MSELDSTDGAWGTTYDDLDIFGLGDDLDSWETINVLTMEEDLPLIEDPNPGPCSDETVNAPPVTSTTVASKKFKRELTECKIRDRGGRKRQRTEGEPCLLEVCQFPVLTSNGINIGDVNAVESAAEKFICDDCGVCFGQRGASGSIEMRGRDSVNNLSEMFMDAIPDALSEIKSIKLKRYENICYQQQIHGTVIFPMKGEHSTSTLTYLKDLAQSRIESHINFLESENSDVSMLKILRDDMIEHGKPVKIHLDIVGNLTFAREAQSALELNTAPEDKRLVYQFELIPRIKSIKPSKITR